MKATLENVLAKLQGAKKTGDHKMKKLLTSFLRKLRLFKKDSDDKELEKRGVDLIPAWFTGRMMDDVWGFRLMLENGTVIAIECIDKVVQAKDGSLWLDVQLLDHPGNSDLDDDKIFIAPHSDRPCASINASKVVAAFEICTS